jgi:hypothetical protein
VGVAGDGVAVSTLVPPWLSREGKEMARGHRIGNRWL